MVAFFAYMPLSDRHSVGPIWVRDCRFWKATAASAFAESCRCSKAWKPAEIRHFLPLAKQLRPPEKMVSIAGEIVGSYRAALIRPPLDAPIFDKPRLAHQRFEPLRFSYCGVGWMPDPGWRSGGKKTCIYSTRETVDGSLRCSDVEINELECCWQPRKLFTSDCGGRAPKKTRSLCRCGITGQFLQGVRCFLEPAQRGVDH